MAGFIRASAFLRGRLFKRVTPRFVFYGKMSIFTTAIQRAIESCGASGYRVSIGSGAGHPIEDFMLTCYACYRNDESQRTGRHQKAGTPRKSGRKETGTEIRTVAKTSRVRIRPAVRLAVWKKRVTPMTEQALGVPRAEAEGCCPLAKFAPDTPVRAPACPP